MGRGASGGLGDGSPPWAASGSSDSSARYGISGPILGTKFMSEAGDLQIIL